MRKHKRACLLGALGLLLVLVSRLGTSCDPEPKFRGATISQWLHGGSPVADVAAMEESREALIILGTNNLPLLVSRLRYNAAPGFLYQALDYMPNRFVPGFLFPSQDPASDALEVFKVLGPGGRSAIPEIQKIVNSSASSFWAEQALGHLQAGSAGSMHDEGSQLETPGTLRVTNTPAR